MAVEQIREGVSTPLGRAEVLRALRRWLHLPDEDSLDVLMAVAIAIYLPGDPLWLYYVGPPGATKTEPLRALSGPRVQTLSTLTPNTLISGLKGNDVDLLPHLDPKVRPRPQSSRNLVRSLNKGRSAGRRMILVRISKKKWGRRRIRIVTI